MRTTSGGSYCAVVNCTNGSVKSRKYNLNLSFHRFPRDERRNEWLNRCKRMDNLDLKKGSYFVCSAHFAKEDFEPDLRAKLMNEPRRRRLKSTAIPHLNLPSDTFKLVTKMGNGSNSARHKRMKEKQMKQNDLKMLETLSTSIEEMPVIDTANAEAPLGHAVIEMSKNNSTLKVSEIIEKQQREIEELKSTVASMKEQLEMYSGRNLAHISHFLELPLDTDV